EGFSFGEGSATVYGCLFLQYGENRDFLSFSLSLSLSLSPTFPLLGPWLGNFSVIPLEFQGINHQPFPMAQPWGIRGWELQNAEAVGGRRQRAAAADGRTFAARGRRSGPEPLEVRPSAAA